MPLPLVYHPDYVTWLPDGHRFPMPKFGKVYEWIIKDGIASLDQFHLPEIADAELIGLAHEAAYIDSYFTGTIDPKAMRRIGFPWSPALVTRTCTAVGGTVLTAKLALTHGLACNTAGGTHHAHRDFGSGFCIFNDLAVAARAVQEAGLVEKVLIIDLDVHQGDGTASIFHGDESVFTFSMHCGKNFPFRKHMGNLDVSLPVGATDDDYMERLRRYLPQLLLDVQPELVFYDAGVDPHKEDRLGKLALTDTGLYQRDLFVLAECLAADIPAASVVGGGYDKDHDRLALRHCSLFRAASELVG